MGKARPEGGGRGGRPGLREGGGGEGQGSVKVRGQGGQISGEAAFHLM